MKAKMLKIAGVKSEKEFYEKYPTEEAFMKAHGKAFKKAMMGTSIQDKGQLKKLDQLTDFGGVPKAQVGSYVQSKRDVNPGYINYKDIRDSYDKLITGSTPEERAAKAAQAQQSQGGGGGGMDIGQIMGLVKMLGKGEHGTEVAKAQDGGLWGGWGGSSSMPTNPDAPTTYTVDPNQTGASQSMGLNTSSLGSIANPNPSGLQSVAGLSGALGKAAPFLGIASNLISGIQKLKDQKKRLKSAESQYKVAQVVGKAAKSTPERVERKYVRPEDIRKQKEEENRIFPKYGKETTYLQLQDGGDVTGQIGGNPTEIQNMYNPGTLYTNLGYEPLAESEIVKQYYYGGGVPKAQMGLDITSLGGQLGSAIGGNDFGETSGGADIGSAIGGGLGMIFGPVGSQIGQFAGGLIGGALDKKGKKIKEFQGMTRREMEDTARYQMGQNLHSQYSSFVKEGGLIPYNENGWISHDWQPQVITHFGEHSMNDLLKADPMMNTLRTGGHIRQNYQYPMDQFAMGGDLKTHWGGKAETMSYNPYLPEGGETVMFRGQSHEEADGKGRTGIGVTYGDSPVEVERGEPAVKLKDGTSGDSSLVVYGNLKIPNHLLHEIGDPKAKGKKFKTYVADLSKKEAKQNKIIDKASEISDSADLGTAFGKLKLSTAKAMIDGANAKLKQYAEYKQNAAAVQNAYNDAAEEHGLVADDLVKGKITFDKSKEGTAKFGTNLKKAKDGITLDSKIKGLLALLEKKGYKHQVTSTGRAGAMTKSGKTSRHSVGGAADVQFPELGSKAYQAMLEDKDVAKYIIENGLTAINEYDPEVKKLTGATGDHIHFGFDKGTPTADAFRNAVRTKYEGGFGDVAVSASGPEEEVATTKGTVPKELLLKQVYKESNFNPKAFNEKSGAKGMAQIKDGALSDYIKATGDKDVDLYNPKDAAKVQEWYMNNLYNSDLINKPNQSEEVRIAKTLAAYNWGYGNLKKFLIAQKKRGVDIYNSTDWVNKLPGETKNYVGFIGLNKDIDDTFNQEAYSNSLKDEKYKGVTAIYQGAQDAKTDQELTAQVEKTTEEGIPAQKPIASKDVRPASKVEQQPLKPIEKKGPEALEVIPQPPLGGKSFGQFWTDILGDKKAEAAPQPFQVIPPQQRPDDSQVLFQPPIGGQAPLITADSIIRNMPPQQPQIIPIQRPDGSVALIPQEAPDVSTTPGVPIYVDPSSANAPAPSEDWLKWFRKPPVLVTPPPPAVTQAPPQATPITPEITPIQPSDPVMGGRGFGQFWTDVLGNQQVTPPAPPPSPESIIPLQSAQTPDNGPVMGNRGFSEFWTDVLGQDATTAPAPEEVAPEEELKPIGGGPRLSLDELGVSQEPALRQQPIALTPLASAQTPADQVAAIGKTPEDLANDAAMAKAIRSGQRKNNLLNLLNVAGSYIMPYLRPTDAEALDPSQLYGEMAALATNQLEPVQAQLYQPQLQQAYDVSFQDQLNEVTAQTRAAERMAQGNPAALASIAAQANQAKSKILADQFRMNQGLKMGIYNANRQELNQAYLKNLDILDRQYERSSQAKSRTKEVAQAALSSISDKIARNKLENRTLQTYENLYNYRYDPRFRAINYNQPTVFNTSGSGGSGRGGGLAPGYDFTYDSSGNIIGTRKVGKEDEGKNGAKVKRNGDIAKAMKNL